MILSRLLCPLLHDNYMVSTKGSRMFVRCLKCGRESTGIITGGHRYAHHNTNERARTVAKAFKPRRKR